MWKLNYRNLKILINKKGFTTVNKPDEKVKYTNTVFLPKTEYPSVVKPEKIPERDHFIQKEARFLNYYEWQREHMKGPEYILLDGPPYANGKIHMGHAINKIYKDIVLRSQLIQGNKVHFVPGWDCHGLPIELKALKTSAAKLTAEEIRSQAREFAKSCSETHKAAFKQWGVIGDWEKQCYYTFDNSYVINELQLFWQMYEKGLIFRDLKPVYWSPSSKSALAEAELIYKPDHESYGLTVSLETTTTLNDLPICLLIWTTTPWTLPLNKLVCYSTNLNYSLVELSSSPGYYVIANETLQEFNQKYKGEVQIKGIVTHEALSKMQYKHPWRENDLCQIVEAKHVEASGTGLVHSAPAHGQDDFLMGLQLGMKLECFVDENGLYTEDIGPDLSGLDVLKEGSKRVIEKLGSRIILNEKIRHSYPYDWRTNKPVLIRASHQWFINTGALKAKALEALATVSTPIDRLESLVKSRPYWCLSRQRKWGVPIPVFYQKSTGKPLISKTTINHLCQLIKSSSPDIWWSEKLENLFPQKACEEFNVRIEDIVKGEDIMDVWFDSGVAWSAILNGRQSDICIEGNDQYTGWFQSMLLTSIAVTGKAPYKKLLTHGFAVDKNGKKMSKSVGNVIDPEVITDGKKALGVDTLRWWVANHSLNEQIPVSVPSLEKNCQGVYQIKKMFRFLVGALADLSTEELEKAKITSHLDRYTLNVCHDFYRTVIDLYNKNSYCQVCLKLMTFIANDISGQYVSTIRDILYCDPLESERRLACRYVLQGIFNTLTHSAAPILPHLAEEAHIYHPFYKSQKKLLFYNSDMWSPPENWKDDSSNEAIELVLEARSNLHSKVTGDKQLLECTIEAEGDKFELFKEVNDGCEESIDSELTSLLGVAKVNLKQGKSNISVIPTNNLKCPRCRRSTMSSNDSLCPRCESVLSA